MSKEDSSHCHTERTLLSMDAVTFSRQVVEGTETLKKMEAVQTFNERPMKDIKITDCGAVDYSF